MTNKSLKIITISLFLSSLIFSCQRSESYIVSKQADLRSKEREDHQKCVDQGISFGEWGDVTTEIYWRCRYNMVQKRMTLGSNAEEKRINDVILANYNRSRQIVLSKIEGNVNTADHSRCLSMGHTLDGANEEEIDQYYSCREQLILDRTPPAPKITHAYEASILPPDKAAQYLNSIAASQDVSPEVVRANNMVNNYPLCAGLNYRSNDFAKCADAQENSKKCLGNIRIELSKKNIDDKIYCQQQAFIQFPDNYAIMKNKSHSQLQKEKEQKKEEQMKEDKKNEEEARKNMTLRFLQGAIVDLSSSRKEEKKLNPKEASTILYSKIDLLRLREQFIERCDKSMEEKIPAFASDAASGCMKMAVEWDR